MDSLIVLTVIVGIVGLAVFYIRREKKRGARCIGCPDSKTCSAGGCQGNCSGCSRSCQCAGQNTAK